MTRYIFPIKFIVFTFLACLGTACHYSSDSDENGYKAADNNQNQAVVAGEIRRSLFDAVSLEEQLRKAGEGSSLTLQLFDNIEVRARLISSTNMIPGVISYRYEITEPEDGMLIISAEGNIIAGNIELQRSNRIFLIQPVYDSNDYVLIELDPSQMDILDGDQPVYPDN
ncbi:MAG: hypothetical protein ACNA8K_07535 [Cyclonatronaceae bacterium]